MNIAFLNDIGILGGGEIWVLKMARALARRGHAVSVLCPHRSELFYAALDAGIDLFGYNFGQGVPFHESIYQFLRSRKIDVLYCTVLGRFCESRQLGAIVDRIPGCKLFLKTGLPPVPALSAEYYGFDEQAPAQALHVVSEENRSRFLEWQAGSEIYVQLIREGVDLAHFQPDDALRASARREWGIADDEILIANTSRLHAMKGHDNLLLAAHELVRAGRRVRFLFAGAGDEKGRLEALRDQVQLQDRASFIGHQPEPRALLAAADVFCHPSLFDGLPNSVIEAMAMGLPVIASHVGGIPELISDGENGLLIAPHDIRAIERGIARMLDDPELRKSFGTKARETAQRYSFESSVDEWMAAVQGPSRRPSRPIVKGTAFPVLFLLTHLRTGGEETEVAILAKYLDRSRFPVSIVSAFPVGEPSPAAERLREYGVEVDTACHGLDDKVTYLVEKIRREHIRLVVACQDTQLAYEAFQRLGVDECRLIEHAGIAAEVHRIPKNRTAVLVAVSEQIAAAAEPLFTTPRKARYLPSMVDMATFRRDRREELRKAYAFDGAFVAVFVGRLDAKKGIQYLVEAARTLLPEFPQLRFIIAGPIDAYQEEYGRDLIRDVHNELGTEKFMFTGARKDVPDILCAADMLILPSRGEGMSHVINEAGAAALPVVAFDDGAAREQLENGSSGVLVPPGDGSALTNAIRNLLVHAPTRELLGSHLRSRVERDYSADVVMPQWNALLEEVAQGMEPVVHAPALRLVPQDSFDSFPAEIQVETNTACNATCVMCPYPEVSKEIPQGRMDLALYQKILEECSQERSLRRIEPFLNNEPFTDTRMVDWLTMAKEQVPHALLTLTTNGSLLTPKITDRLIQTKLDAIWFSFNGSTKETYEKIMGLSFDLVKRNIDYLLDRKPDSLRVFTNMIETEPMRGEIADNIRYWQSRGVQSGSSPLVNRAGNVSNFVDLNYKKHAERPVRLCELLYHKMYIGYNGDVLLCCMDWRRKVVLGNVRTQSLRDVWNGPKYTEYRRMQEHGRSRELDLCGTCSYICA